MAANEAAKVPAAGTAKSGEKSGETSREIEVEVRDVGEAIVAALGHGGIDHLFFCSGTELGFYQEAIAKAQALGRPAPRLIAMTHEYACLNAALGYAAVSGKPAVTSVHVDVGTQHQGGALHTAWRSGLPVLMTAGAPATSGPGERGARDAAHFWTQQVFDQNGIVRQFTKWEHRLEHQDNPGLMVSRALQVAQTEPCGPTYLSLPREIVYRALGWTRFPTASQLGIPRPSAPAPEVAAEIAARLLRARNPVIVAGGGRNPQTVPALVALSELAGLPIVQCAWHAYHSFPMNHPLYQGKRSLAEFDAVLALECDVPWVPGPRAPTPDAWIGVIDVDPIKHRIPTYEFTADLRLAADPLTAIRAITQVLTVVMSADDRARAAGRTRRWTAAAAERIAAAEREARAVAAADPIDPRWLSYRIAQMLDDNSLVIDDTTQDRVYPYLRLARPGSYFHNPGSAGGWAPGAALGAKLADPARDVIAVTGDGFYMYGAATAAIWAAVRHRAPFVTVIYQNRSYTTGTVAVANAYPDGYAQRAGFDGGYLEPAMDFAKEAEAAGGWGENVRDPAQVGPALERALEHARAGRPAVVAVWLARLLQHD
jgi:acetolactate synthase I/II/III large subunit